MRILIQGLRSLSVERSDMIRKISLIILTVFFFCSLLLLGHAQEQFGNVIAAESGNAQTDSISLNTYEDKLKYWQSLSDEQRQVIRERVKKITPEQMRLLRERLDEFKKLPSSESERIKINYKRFKQMPYNERIDLEQRYQRFQRLPEERKIELRRRLRQAIKSDGLEVLFKDEKNQGNRDKKVEAFELQRDRKQNRQVIIKKRIENRKRFINRRRSPRR